MATWKHERIRDLGGLKTWKAINKERDREEWIKEDNKVVDINILGEGKKETKEEHRIKRGRPNV